MENLICSKKEGTYHIFRFEKKEADSKVKGKVVHCSKTQKMAFELNRISKESYLAEPIENNPWFIKNLEEIKKVKKKERDFLNAFSPSEKMRGAKNDH